MFDFAGKKKMRSVSHPGTHINITLNDIESTKSQIIFEY